MLLVVVLCYLTTYKFQCKCIAGIHCIGDLLVCRSWVMDYFYYYTVMTLVNQFIFILGRVWNGYIFDTTECELKPI